MSVSFKDYYQLLDVSKTASQDELSKAFKKMARKYHPDLNPDNAEAEKKFKEINEAYEVLKDPEKRKLYDSLGPNWQHGQNFQPPPGFDQRGFRSRSAGGPQFEAGGFGGFSDFFETMFGGQFRGQQGYEGDPFGSGGFGPRQTKGRDVEVGMELPLEDAYSGGTKTISFQEQVVGPDGMPRMETKSLQVNIPAGIKNGSRIRLAGQGSPGLRGGPSGDLYLKIHIAPHPLFKLEGNSIVYDLMLAPWEAALGSKVRIPTLSGAVDMNIPAGSGSGKKLRLRGKGLGKGADQGDQLIRVMITVPPTPSDQERALWEQLAQVSDFQPREHS
ncbi:curved DNA-binding protein [Desulfonatronum thiosulfatophilum]|uniref:Curved DNA-binding protein n=1 Tax=Desulfonatronum thiosulfatophilum TaxID=617002 RepID=A0A1G6BC42_9BACT|nr:J domain-containing protein [Desulfonatronum thiosulfatophilum]SDB18156.1 curved DNA-binding protein [Desulfonatronum thiosulfatophilum]